MKLIGRAISLTLKQLSTMYYLQRRCIDSIPIRKNVNTIINTIPFPASCDEVRFEPCRALGFNYTKFPNFVGDVDQNAAIVSYGTYANSTVEGGCSENGQLYHCGLLFPRCEDGSAQYPCASLCKG